jgi:uncharacterized lipoprotein YddW (UPF0748 family)
MSTARCAKWAVVAVFAVMLQIFGVAGNGCLGVEEQKGGATEFRAVWSGPQNFNTPEKLEAFIKMLKDANLNGVIALAYLEGFACYPSDIVPRHRWSINPDDPNYDPLGELVKRAHQEGIQVHVYITSNLNNRFKKEKNHPVTLHPEWVSADETGKSLLKYSKGKMEKYGVEGAYLDPGNLKAREFIVKMHTDVMMKYDLDGVQFDYIRLPGTYSNSPGLVYPGRSFGFNPESVRRFKEQYGFDPIDLLKKRKRYMKEMGRAEYERKCYQWDDWRRDQVTAVVRAVREFQLKNKPKMWLSAAVIASPDLAYRTLFQDWRRWEQEGLLDAVAPMAYSMHTPLVVYWIRTAVANAIPGEQVWAGLGAYRVSEMPDELVRQVELCRKEGARGIVFFSGSTLLRNPKMVEALRATCFQQPAAAPTVTRH